MQADFVWLAENYLYGMFLSDDSVLTPVETGLISYTTMVCQELTGPATRHLNGLRRYGVSDEELTAIVQCVMTMMKWAGKDASRIVTLADIESLRNLGLAKSQSPTR